MNVCVGICIRVCVRVCVAPDTHWLREEEAAKDDLPVGHEVQLSLNELLCIYVCILALNGVAIHLCE